MMAVVLFAVAVISVLANLLVSRSFERYVARQQKVRLQDLIANIEGHYDPETRSWNVEYLHGLGMYALYDGYVLAVYDQDGETVWDAERHDMDTCARIMAEISGRMEKRRPGLGGAFASSVYQLALDGRNIGSVAVKSYGPYFLSDSDFRFLDALNAALAAVGALSLLLAFAAGSALARRIARPVAKTAHIARQIADGNYAIRFEGRAKSREFAELAAAVNDLAAGLVEQESLRKRLTVDIAHELRTPLATLGSHLEAMAEGVWEPTKERLASCCEEVGRLNSLVSDLQRLAQAEGDSLTLRKTEVDLMDVARSIVRQFELEAGKKHLSLRAEGESTVVRADRDRLSQVLANLLSNAVKFTPEGGHIRVEVKSAEQSGILAVEDDGIGIPEEELSLVFERFYRTDRSRSRKTGGAGIGLAIVKSIVSAHGGTVSAQRREEGGTRFVVTLPK